jgi:glucose-6-phosphate 1-dehydrogenase
MNRTWRKDPTSALRLLIDSWGWQGVPWYLRSGKFLSETAVEVRVELKPPAKRLFEDSEPGPGRANYLRFRVSPGSACALAARVKLAGKEFVGEQRELYLLEDQREEEAPYDRLLEDAMAGDGALFTREDASKPPGRSSNPSSAATTAFARTSGSWGPKKLTTSSRQMAGTTQSPRTRRGDAAARQSPSTSMTCAPGRPTNIGFEPL